ncbi:hypothetical protein PAE9249_01601 [Paenibacillus sp. CECT 9249]|uniref:SpoIID/LytB domain-containing protein n=1 Tax=Paenibacillus sp. CECT 9249 TaxID=2845385 RepID=UPI001E4E2874|nr:SpoIID/LytB domain-containing protein [Paenibacillus sp. CECT 9249]CAH0119104.1 hypothetical protein PAE9249_01601 [Paenibacillus sp. CECT 9249]
MRIWKKERSRQWSRSVFLAVILSLSLGTASYQPAYADEAAASAKQIRVALFADLGNQYRSIAPTVTMNAGGGMAIGERLGGGIVPLANAGAGETVRFSMDSFMVKALETTDAQAAAGAASRLQAADGAGKVYVMAVSQQSGTVYQVYIGNYASKEEAVRVRDRLAADPALSAIVPSGKPIVTGNLHWLAGLYETEEQANAAVRTIANAGLDAFTAIAVNQGGSVQYAALLGQAADSHELDSVGNEATKLVPGLSLLPTDPASLYLIRRDDMSPGVSGSGQAFRHYFLGGASDRKLWIAPSAAGSGIQVTERAGRMYRGGFELSLANNRLALVNELPLEQYLYSVVGMEVSPSWPEEALKAQAVAARTYALYQGTKYQIADVVDTTLSQAYYGMDKEHPNTIAAVDATAGEVIMLNGKLIEPLYSSNSGGMTADPGELWNSKSDYLVSVQSPDETAEQGLPYWYRVVLPDGKVGYIREDLVQDTGEKTKAGLPVFTVKTDGANIRQLPLIQSDVEPIANVNQGVKAIVLEKTIQSNTMNWIRGPYTSDQLSKSIQGQAKTPIQGPIVSLEVTERGPSQRVTEVRANGQIVDVKYPDSLRSALGGLPSTRFDIEPAGAYSILGANGASGNAAQQNVHALSESGKQQVNDSILVQNGSGDVSVMTKAPSYRFVGQGNGHGAGMSQWGSKGLADQGYRYESILQHYYKGVQIAKP